MVVSRTLPAMLALAALSGCALIPGTHLDFKPEQVVSEDPPGPIEFPLEVHRITPALVANQPPAALPGSPDDNIDLLESVAGYEYRVGAGDVLQVTVYDHPEFSASVASGSLTAAPILTAPPSQAGAAGVPGVNAGGQAAPTVSFPVAEAPQPSTRAATMQVQRDGTIFLAYAGKVQVAGKSVPAIRELVTKALSKYIQKPQVDVGVISYQSQRVYLTGDIGRSGSLPITADPLTLFDAVTRIGLAPTPDLETVVLIRNGSRQTFSLERLFKQGDGRQNTLLRHGDVLNFARNNNRVVFVLGEVGAGVTAVGGAAGRTRGKVPIEADGLSLGEALAQAGGISELTAKPTGVFVLRGARNDDGQPYIKVFQLDATNATAYILADQFQLQPRDFVYVTAAPVVRFNRVMSNIIPFATNFLLFGNLAR